MYRPLGFKNPHKDFRNDMGEIAYTEFEAGADAMYDALWKMAEESPTKTFTLDVNAVNIYEDSNES